MSHKRISSNKNDEEQITVNITQSLRPAYYDDFKCLAQDCKLTCCAGWRITMNRKDYLKIRKQSGSEELMQEIKQYTHKIKNSQHEMLYAEIHRRENNFCPMIMENGLCRLQAECGHDALPNVCKTFPRSKRSTTSGYVEYSLSLACESVLELLWNLPNGIEFIAEKLQKKEYKVVVFDKSSLYCYFQEIRSLCIGLLQDRRFSMGQRILLMGVFLQKLPSTSYDVPNWLAETEAILASPDIVHLASSLIKPTIKTSEMFFIQNINTLGTIQFLKNFKKELLDKFIKNIEETNTDYTNITVNYKLYIQCKENFYKIFEDIEYFFENLAIAVFFESAFPHLFSKEDMWKSYVNFCNIYSLFRFMAITSCDKIVPNQKERLFTSILLVSRAILHDSKEQNQLRDSFFKNESSSLAHMAVLLSE